MMGNITNYIDISAKVAHAIRAKSEWLFLLAIMLLLSTRIALVAYAAYVEYVDVGLSGILWRLLEAFILTATNCFLLAILIERAFVWSIVELHNGVLYQKTATKKCTLDLTQSITVRWAYSPFLKDFFRYDGSKQQFLELKQDDQVIRFAPALLCSVEHDSLNKFIVVLNGLDIF